MVVVAAPIAWSYNDSDDNPRAESSHITCGSDIARHVEFPYHVEPTESVAYGVSEETEMTHNDSTPKATSMDLGVSTESDFDQVLIMLALNAHICEARRLHRAHATPPDSIRLAGTHTDQ